MPLIIFLLQVILFVFLIRFSFPILLVILGISIVVMIISYIRRYRLYKQMQKAKKEFEDTFYSNDSYDQPKYDSYEQPKYDDRPDVIDADYTIKEDD